MQGKCINQIKANFYLIAMLLVISGCQSVPEVRSQAEVMQMITARDEQLSSNLSNEIKNIALKFQEKKIISESEAVFYALHNNAAFKALLIDLKLAKADLISAGLLPNPELLFGFGVINKPYRYAIDFPIEALWLRPIKLRTMKHEADATAYRLTQSGLALIKDVRIAYAQTVLAQERLAVAESAFHLRERIYLLSSKRLTTGDINGKEILLANNDAAIAKRDWELAQFDVKVKMAVLLNAIGVSQTQRNIELSPNLQPACQIEDIDHLRNQSIQQRPDILAAQFAIDAAKEKTNLSKLSWIKFTGTADATSGQVNGHTLGPSIRTTIPIANQNQGATSRAEAELEKATLNLEALKQQASLEISTSHLQYQQSCHDWNIQQNVLLPAAQKMIQLTEHAYREGDISYLQTLEVNRQYLDTQMKAVQIKADLVSKLAELTRNISIKAEDK